MATVRNSENICHSQSWQNQYLTLQSLVVTLQTTMLTIKQDRLCKYDLTWKQIRATTVATEKLQALHILNVFVNLIIQHAKHMRSIILSSVACLAPPYCPTLSHKQCNFLNKVTINCVFWSSLQLLSETYLILRRIQRDVINVHRHSCKVSVILVRFKWNFNFVHRFSINTWVSKLHMNTSNRIWVVPCGWMDKHADITKIIVILAILWTCLQLLCSAECVCVFSEQTVIISLHSNNWMVFTSKTRSVYCAVWTEPL
jgi:hypothetical protein